MKFAPGQWNIWTEGKSPSTSSWSKIGLRDLNNQAVICPSFSLCSPSRGADALRPGATHWAAEASGRWSCALSIALRSALRRGSESSPALVGAEVAFVSQGPTDRTPAHSGQLWLQSWSGKKLQWSNSSPTNMQSRRGDWSQKVVHVAALGLWRKYKNGVGFLDTGSCLGGDWILSVFCERDCSGVGETPLPQIRQLFNKHHFSSPLISVLCLCSAQSVW